MKSFTFFLWTCLQTIRICSVSAIEASPVPFFEKQPNGDLVVLMARGDENDNRVTDLNDYLVIKNANGEFVYADMLEDGDVVASPELVGKESPKKKGKKKGLRGKKKDCFKRICGGEPSLPGEVDSIEDGKNSPKSDAKKGPNRRLQGSLHGRRASVTSGRLRNLVVPLYFKDHAEAQRPVPSQADINVLMNAEEPDPNLCPTGSLKGIYQEMSHGKLQIESTVVPWYVTKETESWYADGYSGTTNLHEALRDALDYLESENIINFADFDEDGDGFIDSITFIHSGYAAEWGGSDSYGQSSENRIWSHKWAIFGDSAGNNIGPWESTNTGVKVRSYHINPGLWGTSGTEIGRIGVIAHETGHFLGMPDLYDTDKSGVGLGHYCLMSSSWGYDSSQLYPPLPSAWVRMQLGWDVPQVPTLGVNAIAAAHTNMQVNQLYIIGEEFGFPQGEYLLIENRQPESLDSLLPQGGLAIYHIDENASLDSEGHPGQAGWPSNGLHYKVALVQSDGNFNLERGSNKADRGDFFYAGGIDSLLPSDDVTSGPFPNTDSYQNGNLFRTGVTISSISAPGNIMTFEISQPFRPPTEMPTPSPTVQPTLRPTLRPTSSPTVAPTGRPTTSPTGSPTTSTAAAASTISPDGTIDSLESITSFLTGYIDSNIDIGILPPSTAPTSTPTTRPSLRPTNMSSQVPTIPPTTPLSSLNASFDFLKSLETLFQNGLRDFL